MTAGSFPVESFPFWRKKGAKPFGFALSLFFYPRSIQHNILFLAVFLPGIFPDPGHKIQID